MRKILIGLVAAIAVATAGFFGFQFYVQHRVATQIEAAFEQIRAGGGKASHGKVSFDPWSRTVTIADIAGESATQPPLVVKIASVTATGVSEKDGTRFSADSIEASDLEVSGGQGGLQVSYKIPRFIVKDYSGPAGGRQLPASASIVDLYRLGLEQFAEVTASSISARDHELRRRDAGRRHCDLFWPRHGRHQGRQDRDLQGRRLRFHRQHAAGRQGREDDRQYGRSRRI